MTLSFVPLRRIAALAVAFTLVVAPIASAQSPEGSPLPALLSPVAFARLVQQRPTEVATTSVAPAPRPSLVRQGTAAMARQAQAAPAQAPQQKSWASRHKVATVLIFVGLGLFTIFLFSGVPFQNHLGG